MKFGKLIEYEMRRASLEILYTKCGGPFYIKMKLSVAIFGSTVWNFIKFVFIVCESRGLTKYIKTNVLTSCFDHL